MQRLREHGLVLVTLAATVRSQTLAARNASDAKTPGPASRGMQHAEFVVELTEQELRKAGAEPAAEYPRATLADRRITSSAGSRDRSQTETARPWSVIKMGGSLPGGCL